MTDKMDILRNKIIEANKAYRLGSPIMTDYEYDALVDALTEINPHDPVLLAIGFIDANDPRKELLPMEMASMNKVKTPEQLEKWMEAKGISKKTLLCLTPKYDGASLCVIEALRRAWTRGDGIYGRRSDDHLHFLTDGVKPKVPDSLITFGEAICSKPAFKDYADDFVNPRNMIAGKLNADKGAKGWNEEILSDSDYIRYGTNLETSNKDKQLEVCNKLNKVKVPFVLTTIDKLTADYLKSLFDEWGKDYTLDGIIVEVNDAKLRQSLGRETNTNPAFARAYKGNFEEIKETALNNAIECNVSKKGLLKPVGLVDPIMLDGAKVSRVTLFNYAFVESMGLGKGAVIKMKRSGQVIPFVISVTKKVTPHIPTKCPACGGKVEWNENHVELVCMNPDCDAKKLAQLISFFSILEVEKVSEGIITVLYKAGYKTVAQILAMKQTDFEKLDKFGARKAEIAYTNIHNKMKGVSLSKFQHATGFFGCLGSKKLKLLEEFSKEFLAHDTYNEKTLRETPGFGDKSVADFKAGLPKFRDFIKGLPITIKEDEKPISDKYAGMSFVFTGFRSKEHEATITKNGGKMSSSVSKHTTYLIMQEKDSGSTKEETAKKDGVKIMDLKEFEVFLTK